MRCPVLEKVKQNLKNNYNHFHLRIGSACSFDIIRLEEAILLGPKEDERQIMRTFHIQGLGDLYTSPDVYKIMI
jgi:hypothetical protein